MVEYVYKKIGSITFGLFSAKQIKKIAAVKVVTPELYDKEGYPVDGGLMDVRLGVIDPGLRCKTCGGKLKECIGHFGYIELARPVIHIKYINHILSFLRSCCRECGRALAEEGKIEAMVEQLGIIEKEKGVEARRALVKEFLSETRAVKKCPYCQSKQFDVKLEKPSTIMEDDKRVSPIEIRARLEKIPDKDVVALGVNPAYARPEWMVLTVMPIPPVTTRPSITLETGERSEDDLTHKLGDIVRINQRLFENINAGAPEIIIEDLWDLLQYHVTTYFDNSITQVPPARHRSGQPLKTLTERIKSKEGRIRHNLAGKRVNYAARTVISPDPKIKFNEVGVPLIVAMELTVPEMVTEWNMKRLKEFIKRGPTQYPGSNYVVRPDGKKKKITDETREQLLEELQPGYIVERHLMDGDIAIFNRQPSLHRMSIMCHKVKILPGRSFRLNPAVCTPYNADFDGDEMNLHIPQNEESRAEAEILMQVQYHIITPKNGLNIVGCIDDSVVGNYLLTRELEFDREDAVELLLAIGVDKSERFKKFGKKVGGKEVFSCLLPDDFEFIGKSKNADLTGNKDVVIKSGSLIKGVIDKATIGEDNGSLIRSLYAKYDEDTGIVILSNIFKLGIQVLFKVGFTTAISDTDLPEKVKAKCDELIQDAYNQVNQFIEDYLKERLEAIPGLNEKETLEVKIIEVLNKVRNLVGEQVQSIADDKNPTIIMARSGATGNILNLAQMSSCVGQHALRGGRISKGFRGRTLPIFKPGDLSPAARGFVKDGFKKGLNPYEFFFGAMTGRDSLMDTALRTPKSGYLYRRLANALQDLRVEYDNTVRDANKTIMQFVYGDDGIDVSKSEGGKINVKKIIKEVMGK
ncbi:MAG TPA: DNA-directed RNA polymerase subunit A' [Candidatus Nanoarchaeia archaeon]|nr:DNA-directed RNA polymerase subunit A' [Candidatus Nanoarchaeia archaeon]